MPRGKRKANTTTCLRPCTQLLHPSVAPVFKPSPFRRIVMDARLLWGLQAVRLRRCSIFAPEPPAVLACRPISGCERLLFQLPPPYAKFSEHLALRRCVMRRVPSLRVLLLTQPLLIVLSALLKHLELSLESLHSGTYCQDIPLWPQTLSENFRCNCRRGVWIMHASNVSITLLQAHLSSHFPSQFPSPPKKVKVFRLWCRCRWNGAECVKQSMYWWPNLTLSYFNYRWNPQRIAPAIKRHNPGRRMSEAELNSFTFISPSIIGGEN